MKPLPVPRIIAFIIALFTCTFSFAQNISITGSAIWMTDFSKDTVFNVTGTLGAAGNVFTGNNFGAHIPNSHTLVFRGGQLKTNSTSGVSEVCSARMYYRVYQQGTTPGAFNQIDFFFGEDCEFPPQFNSGGGCSLGDQKFDLYLPDGTTDPYAPLDLTTLPVGNYTIEVYYAIDGLADCSQTVILNNGGNNYKASFSIQNPTLSSTNPTTCNGVEGTITISGLMPGGIYSIRYTDDGNPIGPVNFVANGSGQIIISGLNAGIYSAFRFGFNGLNIDINSTVTLVGPGAVVPKFKKIDPLCAGAAPPILPTTSQNGITGTWNPAVIDNQVSKSYQFTPDVGQCASSVTIDVIVDQKLTPTFSLGTTLTLCAGATPPSLYKPSDNGITGTWSPSTINNQNSGTYTFHPNPNQCANEATFTVTVNPNTIPTFSFGNSLTICAGNNVPTLPANSVNGISGTWLPSTVDNQNSGTYTFTPFAGQCATTTTFNVTVNPVVTPVFSFGNSLSICSGGSVPSLPATSTNGINGTWSPSIVNNQASAVYTFTPVVAGICAPSVTFNVTVASAITPTFGFGTTLAICAGGTVPALPNTSANGITGVWSSATVDNINSGIYTFTPNGGQCAVATNLAVTVNPIVTPTFSFGTSLTICAGANVPALPFTSTNGITGAWSPSVIDNQSSGTYIFTPAAGQCATSTSFTVSVNSNTIPTFSFGTSLTICAGASIPVLSTTSNNGISGTWNPSAVSTQNSGIYTFTPLAGQCATTTTLTVTFNPAIVPAFSFGTSLSICSGGSVPTLVNTSLNGINGTWSPSVIDNLNSATYIFIPTAGQCAAQINFDVTVNPVVTPVFSFGTAITICTGSNVPTLTTTSSNGVNGTWSPAVVDNQNSATYTFTPAGGQCANSVTFNVTVTPNTVPAFSFGTSLTICTGNAAPALPTTSTNGITGTWSPSVVSSQSSGSYTFTPSPGQCATTATFIVTANPGTTPTFSFGTALNICAGATIPLLPTTSDNGIAGTWSPSSVSNQNPGTYTFTPAAGQCATSTMLTVTMNSDIQPTFSFGTTLTICVGNNVPALPTTSINGISGTWNPGVINSQSSATYTFTPNAGQCAVATILNVTVNPNVIPTFSFKTSLEICAGGGVPTLPSISSNGISGKWSPAFVNNQTSGTYIFTPSAGQCATSTNFVVTVNQNITPVFSFGTALSICAGENVPSLPATSDNGIKGTWSPSVISNQTSDVYTFTPNAGQCASVIIFNVTIVSIPIMNDVQDINVTDGFVVQANLFGGTPSGVSFTWANSNTSIGLGASGTGNVPSFTASNSSNEPAKATITVTPASNGCIGAAKSYVIIVMPLDKDIFVANIFTPNGDGKNDIFYARSNYIKAIEMRIFNQFGRQIELITDIKKGWDGKSKGAPQPVGVYMYTLKATMADGRIIQRKGNVTLLR